MEQNKKEIPMNDIPDIPRQIAVAFASIYIDMRDTVKLASDIQNYAIEYADQQVALNGEWTEIIDSEDMPLPPFEEKSLILCGDGIQHIGYFNGADTNGYVWFCDDNDYRYPTHWQPLPSASGSNQGPTKVQLIETIAQMEATISDLQNQLKKGL